MYPVTLTNTSSSPKINELRSKILAIHSQRNLKYSSLNKNKKLPLKLII